MRSSASAAAVALLLTARPAFSLSGHQANVEAILQRHDLAAKALQRLEDRDTTDDNQSYLDSVCSPSQWTGDEVPPCIEIVAIEAACTPNGSSPLALEAHAQCMCNGSYFPEWRGCRQCLYVHGGLSERNLTFWDDVIASASGLLCGTATPTADFQALFTSAQAAAVVPTTGGTSLVDQSSGNAAVGVYYTATVAQGPGAITGSATAATATGGGASATAGVTTAAATTHASGATAAASTHASGATAATSKTSSSTNVALPTAALVGESNMLLAMVGGVLLAAAL